MKKSVFITFSDVSVLQEEKIILSNINWKINCGEQWVIIGPNGAGKSTLAKTLLGKMPVSKGELIFHFLKNNFQRKKLINQIGYVSFDLHRWLIEAENQKIGRLSNGEAKEFLIDRALKKRPALLILDEPFDGLDQPSRLSFIKDIDQLMGSGIQIILITHQISNIPSLTTHILLLKEGQIIDQGKINKILNPKNIKALYSNKTIQRNVTPTPCFQSINDNLPEILIKMKSVTVRYGKKIVLDNLSWQMKKGENWAIVGPNGVGKSTFLKLITGENTQAYANEITIFGKKKGTGETLWEIKKHIGEIFPETQLNYLKKINSFDVVLSGFFDSVGLYYHPNKKQVVVGRRWVKLLGLEKLMGKKFSQLSTGQQRLILLVRAMVKSPPLLILDEPCQGLDMVNRKQILKIIDVIGKTNTNILYVTHYQKEMPKCITHSFFLQKVR